MIDANLKRAIAKIEVPRSGLTGTGFLCGQGLVLTALHVIADRSERAGPLAERSIKLRFWAPGNDPRPEVDAQLLQYSVAADWALLKCAPPEGCAPLPIGSVRQQGGRVSWTSFGFPELYPVDGLAHHGSITDMDASRRGVWGQLQLHSEELDKDPSLNLIRGLSGGPCIVDGRAVGVLRFVLPGKDEQGRPQARMAAVFACSLRTIAPECTSSFRLPDMAPIPLEAALEDILKPRSPGPLRELARELGIPNTEYIADDRLISFIVPALADAELGKVAFALFHLRPMLTMDEAAQLVDVLACQWVHEDAARHIKDLARREDSLAMALNASMPLSGFHHVTRAGGHFPGWRNLTVQVTNEGPEDQAEGLIEEIGRALRTRGALRGCADQAALLSRLARHAALNNPYFVLIPFPSAEPPRAEVLRRVRDAFPGLRILCLTGPLDAERPPAVLGVEIVRPMIADGQEARAVAAYQQAHADLLSVFDDNQHSPNS